MQMLRVYKASVNVALPSQALPWDMYPALHSHVKPNRWFLHLASRSQSFNAGSEHSSLSVHVHNNLSVSVEIHYRNHKGIIANHSICGNKIVSFVVHVILRIHSHLPTPKLIQSTQ